MIDLSDAHIDRFWKKKKYKEKGFFSNEIIDEKCWSEQKKKLLEQDEAQDVFKDPYDRNSQYSYEELLKRIIQLKAKNLNLVEIKPRKIKPPMLYSVSSTRTLWYNFQEICIELQRPLDHVYRFYMAKLDTEFICNERVMIRGRYYKNKKKIESLLRKYVAEYVTCKMCQSPNTNFERDSSIRLYYCNCRDCGSRRSVAPFKHPFRYGTISKNHIQAIRNELNVCVRLGDWKKFGNRLTSLPESLFQSVVKYRPKERNRMKLNPNSLLHILCSSSENMNEINPSLKSVIRSCPHLLPMSLQKRDKDRNTIVHNLCETEVGEKDTGLNLLLLLLLKDPSTLMKMNTRGHLPLHVAIENRKEWDFLKHLISSASIRTETKISGYLPLHLAILNYASEAKEIFEIWKAYPEATIIVDNNTNLFPFQLAAASKKSISQIYFFLRKSPNVVGIL